VTIDLRMWLGDSPTELAQPRVADPEVMTHFVNDRPPNLLDGLGIAVAHGADGTPVDRDPVRQGAGAERRPTRQWHFDHAASVQPDAKRAALRHPLIWI
jgi:hypothetical protein